MPTTNLYDEKSWASTLQGYAAQRTTLPWDALDVRRPEQVAKNNQNHAASRVYNPVLMKYNDPEVEHKKIAEEAAVNAVRMNIAKDKQLCYTQKWNIVSHKAYDGGVALVEKPKPPDSRVPFNIVSLRPKSDHIHQRIGIIPPDISPRLEVE